MKKLILIVLAALMLVPCADARRNKKKAGSFDDGTYVDAKYPFQMDVLENWKLKVNDADDQIRIVLTQTNWDPPSYYINDKDYTWIPTLSVYVDTSTWNPHMFMDSLIAEDYRSDQKKDMLRHMEFLNRSDFIPRGRDRLEVDGESGLFWRGSSDYIQNIETSSGGGRRVYGKYGGGIAAVQHGKYMLTAHVMCEFDLFQPVVAQVKHMLGTIKWTDVKKEKKSKDKPVLEDEDNSEAGQAPEGDDY